MTEVNTFKIRWGVLTAILTLFGMTMLNGMSYNIFLKAFIPAAFVAYVTIHYVRSSIETVCGIKEKGSRSNARLVEWKNVWYVDSNGTQIVMGNRGDGILYSTPKGYEGRASTRARVIYGNHKGDTFGNIDGLRVETFILMAKNR